MGKNYDDESGKLLELLELTLSFFDMHYYSTFISSKTTELAMMNGTSDWSVWNGNFFFLSSIFLTFKLSSSFFYTFVNMENSFLTSHCAMTKVVTSFRISFSRDKRIWSGSSRNVQNSKCGRSGKLIFHFHIIISSTPGRRCALKVSNDVEWNAWIGHQITMTNATAIKCFAALFSTLSLWVREWVYLVLVKFPSSRQSWIFHAKSKVIRIHAEDLARALCLPYFAMQWANFSLFKCARICGERERGTGKHENS